MNLTRREGSAERVMGELRADGSIYVTSRLVGRVRDTQVLTPRGHVIWDLQPDGSMREGDHLSAISITDEGDINTPDERLSLRPDHWLVGLRRDGTTHMYPYQFDRVPSEARRTAAVVAVFTLGAVQQAQGRPPTVLTVPSHTSGALEPWDRVRTVTTVGDDYVLTLRANHPVTIVVRGGTSTTRAEHRLDVFAMVSRGNHMVTYDDDSAGDLNSRIVFTPAEDGDYGLEITSAGSSFDTGTYEIDILDGAHADLR